MESGSPHIGVAEQPIDHHGGISSDDKSKALSRLNELIARRCKKQEKAASKKASAPGDASDEEGDEESGTDSEAEEGLRSHISPILTEMAEKEIGHLLGRVPGSAALNEEETDEGMIFQQPETCEPKPAEKLEKKRPTASASAPAAKMAKAGVDEGQSQEIDGDHHGADAPGRALALAEAAADADDYIDEEELSCSATLAMMVMQRRAPKQ